MSISIKVWKCCKLFVILKRKIESLFRDKELICAEERDEN